MTIEQRPPTITIGTRGSKLALTQTELVRAALLAAHPALQIAVEQIATTGDLVQDRPFGAIGGSGLFVTEIEQALRAGRVDLAVHSAKDLPARLPADMLIAAVPPRADPRDVLVSRAGQTLAELPPGARVGTSSARRACQLRHLRPDLEVAELRGNVDTRLRKLREGQYDAIVLAAAGLARLGLAEQITEYLDPDVILPAVSQGALALEVRAADAAAAALLRPLDDPGARAAVSAERAFLAQVGGGCQTPVAAHARLEGAALVLSGLIGARDGRLVRGSLARPAAQPEALGAELAARLLDQGGRELLDVED